MSVAIYIIDESVGYITGINPKDSYWIVLCLLKIAVWVSNDFHFLCQDIDTYAYFYVILLSRYTHFENS